MSATPNTLLEQVKAAIGEICIPTSSAPVREQLAAMHFAACRLGCHDVADTLLGLMELVGRAQRETKEIKA